MAIGPGKYDDVTTRVREEMNAEAVIVIIIGGKFGHGFSVQASGVVTGNLPAILRQLADDVESDLSV